MTMLPDERLVALRPELLAALRDAAREVSGEAFADFFDAPMRSLLLDGFERAGAHEGTVWLLDDARAELIPRFNSGPHAERFVGTFRQSVRAGMIGMVAATEQAICENEVCTNARQDRTLDEQLRLKTWSCSRPCYAPNSHKRICWQRCRMLRANDWRPVIKFGPRVISLTSAKPGACSPPLPKPTFQPCRSKAQRCC